MKDRILIYCSGSIKKGNSDTVKNFFWSEKERREIQSILSPTRIIFLKPDERSDDLNNQLTVFGRDHYQVSISDFVIIDARERRGIGVGIEMLSAKIFKKPLISVVPKNSHYRRDKLEYLGSTSENYIHAHLFGLSDAIVEDFKEAGEWIKEFLQNPRSVKDDSIITMQ